MVIGPTGRYQIDFLEEYTAEALLAELCRDQAFGSRFSCATDFVALPAAEGLSRT
jgi:hypothetical protein